MGKLPPFVGCVKPHMSQFSWKVSNPLSTQALQPHHGAMVPAHKHFGRWLAKARIDRGLSQEQLSSRVRVSSNTIYRAERSTTCNLHRSNAVAIAKALDRERPLTDEDWHLFFDFSNTDETSVQAHSEPAASAETSTADSAVRAALVDRVLALSARTDPRQLLRLLDVLQSILSPDHADDSPADAIITPAEKLGRGVVARQYIPPASPLPPLPPAARRAAH